MSRNRTEILIDVCKGCGLCVEFCPREIIKLSEDINGSGYHPAEITDQDKCIACGFCYLICPEPAAVIYRGEKK